MRPRHVQECWHFIRGHLAYLLRCFALPLPCIGSITIRRHAEQDLLLAFSLWVLICVASAPLVHHSALQLLTTCARQRRALNLIAVFIDHKDIASWLLTLPQTLWLVYVGYRCYKGTSSSQQLPQEDANDESTWHPFISFEIPLLGLKLILARRGDMHANAMLITRKDAPQASSSALNQVSPSDNRRKEATASDSSAPLRLDHLPMWATPNGDIPPDLCSSNCNSREWLQRVKLENIVDWVCYIQPNPWEWVEASIPCPPSLLLRTPETASDEGWKIWVRPISSPVQDQVGSVNLFRGARVDNGTQTDQGTTGDVAVPERPRMDNETQTTEEQAGEVTRWRPLTVSAATQTTLSHQKIERMLGRAADLRLQKDINMAVAIRAATAVSDH